MCGISLLIDSHDPRVDEMALRRMNALIAHRGPDGDGFFVDDYIGMGHRMLRITDHSDLGRQPMHGFGSVLVFNGEIYNFRSLRAVLIKHGYQFQSDADTEVVLAAYDYWGIECVEHFNGMWAFALYDKQRRRVFCSRDRFGIKPLFYSRRGKHFIVGSEIKQLLAFDSFSPSINEKIAFNFLYHGRIDQTSESFFEDVHFLPAGHHLLYDLLQHKYSVRQWYQPAPEPQVQMSFPEAASIFRERFTDSILEHGRTRDPLGACLSGGLDSTSIVGMLSATGTPVDTFSTCYTQHASNEIDYINEAAAFYDVNNYKHYPAVQDMLGSGLLQKMVYHQDQPVLSGSFFSEYKVFELAAARDIRIMMSGQGADEYLGGYNEFMMLRLNLLLRKKNLPGLLRAIADASRKQNQPFAQALRSFILFGTGLPYLRKRVEERGRNFANAVFHPGWIAQQKDKNQNETRLNDYDSLRQLSEAALTRYSLPHQLHAEDRHSMMHSIESRLPFLDHRLVEFTTSLPDQFIIRKGATKAVLRSALKDILPPGIHNRHSKLGFPGPEEPLLAHHGEEVRKAFQHYIHELPRIFSPALLQLFRRYKLGEIP
ncbi:MAG: asparagine synthase (glutamine-hydrolyzing), partial [Bacteroidota bacterium]|nr:asparagine synthase (glutamine-hydrolyzing) [Bacteroidota bacterium]